MATPYPYDSLAGAADVPDGRPNILELSVTELSFALKRTLEEGFSLVRVRGEISQGVLREEGQWADHKVILSADAFTVETPAGPVKPLLIAGEFFFSASVLVYNIAQVSFRQRICPPALLGRMNASIRFIVWGVMPIGGLVAGLLSTGIGVLPTIIVGCSGSLLGGIPVIFSKLWRMRTLPTAMVAATDSETPPTSAFEPGAEPEGSSPTEPLT